MSRFFSEKYAELIPYVPGEQPKDRKYIKLNTNESPYPPSEAVTEAVKRESVNLMLYSDPESSELRAELAKVYKLAPSQIIATNSSDETLNFAFMAFGDESHPLAFPDITYGFYPVFAKLNHIPFEEIPLNDDFTIDPDDYIGIGKTVVIANPNAPTGITLPLADIEEIVRSNPDNIVIVDEAYVDFGGESAVGLIDKYDNLLVIQTFSKSRSMAGARLGFGMGNEKIIADLNTIKYSTNPYNVNRMTSAAGIAALRDGDYYEANCKKTEKIREYTAQKLREAGFYVTDSKTNFVFAGSEKISGEKLYSEFKKRGILIRHFSIKRIKDFNRITIGTEEQMTQFFEVLNQILEEQNV